MKKRHKHNLSHYRLITGNAGALIPLTHYEVLPGDTIKHRTSVLLRASPLLAPVMHRFHTRVHHFYVPFRLLWDGWEDFITGVSSTTVPTIDLSGNVDESSLLDYLGIRPGTYGGTTDESIAVWPIRAYNKIWGEYFRDQDLQAEVGLDDLNLLNVAWGKDGMTTMRPWAQKGPSISLPIAGSAPVKTSSTATVTGAMPGLHLTKDDGSAVPAGRTLGVNNSQIGYTSTAYAGTDYVYPDNLYAELQSASAGDVRDVRLAFALQRYEEARAQYGSRYVEFLRYYGIRPSDARLQRPEYLGGGKRDIQFSEVLQTAEGSEPVGTMRGHGISGMGTRPFVKFFEEHGIVMSLLSVRPQSIYMDGIHRSWLKRVKEDYFQEELQFIGQQPVLNGEVYFDSSGNNNDVMGFGDRYYEYRHHWSSICGDFRSTLDFWHAGRKFASRPALNASFVECVPTDRIFAVPSEDTLWITSQHRIGARRLVSNSTKARII